MKPRQLTRVKPITPYLLALIAALMVITYVPAIALFLPKLFGYVPSGSFTGLF